MATLKQNSAALAALSEKVRSLPKRPELVEITLTPAAEDVIATPNIGEAFSKVTIEGDTNLTPENIAEGVSIFGVEGAHKGGGGASDIDALIDGTITEVNSGATKVKAYAFYDNMALTIANFPNATSIGNRAFGQCLALESAKIPNATSVGSYVFHSCSKLTSAKIPNATSIGDWMFGYCYKLTNADFPNATSIGRSAFQQCEALTSVDISSATEIKSQAFSYCNVLKSVILRSETVCTLSSTDVFADCYHILGTQNSTYNPNGDKDGYIYVPANLVEAYKTATNWSTYASQIRAIEGSGSNKLATPDIMVEGDCLYINNISNAASVSVYCTTSEDASEADWVLLNTFSCYDDDSNHIGDQAFIDWGRLDEWGVPSERPLFFSVIAHAPNKEDSDRSNVSVMEY